VSETKLTYVGTWSGIPRKRRFWDWARHCWVEVITFDVGRQDNTGIRPSTYGPYEGEQTDERPVEQQIEDYLSAHGSASISELNSQLHIPVERIRTTLGDFPDLFVSYKTKATRAGNEYRRWKLV
jgi:hypothetical protein